jgi:hypothetical protein
LESLINRRDLLTGNLASSFTASFARRCIAELTGWDDCANGADVLLPTVLRVDQS